MSWDDFKSVNNTAKDATFKSTNTSHFYAIYRIGKRYKQQDGKKDSGINMIKAFQKHMEREVETLNANTKIKNEIIIGNENVYETVKEYIKDVKLRKDNVIAREILLTASPDFFHGLMQKDLNNWKELNYKFLKNSFGDNCVYATLHKDEKTWHIHALIVPKFKNKKGENVLSNKRYFDGIEKLREWQTNYAKEMQTIFKCLNRGVKYSKAKHIEIRNFYNLVNKELNEKDISQLAAKAKNSELLQVKLKAIEKTLQVYKNYNSKNDLEKQKAILESKSLTKEISKLKENEETYKQALSLISQSYKVPQYVIKEALKFSEQINEKEI